MKAYVKLFWIPALFIASQAACIYTFLHGLLHFYDHAIWVNVINALGVPLSIHNVYRIGRTTGGIWQDIRKREAHLARWKLLATRGRTIKGPEEMEAYIREIEEVDPAMGADIRKNLRDFLK
jgi:hypothetical protein